MVFADGDDHIALANGERLPLRNVNGVFELGVWILGVTLKGGGRETIVLATFHFLFVGAYNPNCAFTFAKIAWFGSSFCRSQVCVLFNGVHAVCVFVCKVRMLQM